MHAVRKQFRDGLYRIEGPAKLVVKSGGFYALGRFFGEKDELIVPRGIVICLKVDSSCIVDIVGGIIVEAKPEEEVIDIWKKMTDEIVKPSRIVIVGETDSGKSTFSTFLLNTALRKGFSVALIDADVGQNDVGLPGTIALAFPQKPVSWLGELDPVSIYFVGSNSPLGLEDSIIVGIVKLVKLACDKDLIIVNTDGWINNRRALQYKAKLVEAVDTDTLVIMEGGGASEPIAKIFEKTKITVVRVPTPPASKGKERELRKLRRELSYLSLLQKSSVKMIELDKVKFWGVYSFNGQPDPKMSNTLSSILGLNIYVENCGNSIIVVVKDERDCKKIEEAREQLSKLVSKNVYITCLNELHGFLVGLINERLEHVGVGILEELNLEERVVKLRTPYNLDDVRLLMLGRLRLTKEGVERERSIPRLA
ncbi:MAG: Clp1/GlmU family protein [Thermofilaceae archaeon]|nr:Clp1/GlmU family protein [Thermofilaceae archaeon]MCX8180572.1 Clp1/GlmU family protein [Thermofilaceae archaeon]MDW8003674.1 Clp1/GlmU family protein [Thermofilaceae archaeon]